MSGPDRRTFVKRMAATAGAAAAGALVPGTGVGEELGRWVAGLGLSWARTPCILCDVGCGLVVGLENGRATAVRGDPDAEVNRGLACAKGYHSVQALYGRDRLARARVRRGDRLVEVPVAEALDLVAAALRETVAAHGKDSIGLYGSGYWSIPAAYAGAKLFKGGLGTNNVDSEGRLTSGSAMAGARTTFGLDGSVGCFQDIEHADVFVLWNTNLAEAHPVLFSRLLEQRQRRPGVRIIDVATRTTRTSYASDRSLLFAPRTDLALANAVAAEIVARDRASGNFLARHVSFRKEERDRGRDPGNAAPIPGDGAPATFEDYARFLQEYSPEEVERTTGMPASDIRWLASLYAEPGLRVMTLWDGNVDGQIRGTSLNNVLHNLHLLVGKIATPGNGPLALAAGASTCGAAADAGGLAERLPGGFVTAAEDRERTARIWGVPADRIDPSPGRHALALFHGLETGDVRFLWIQGADPLASLPDLARYRAGAVREGRFLVVSDVYPTATTAVADVVLPSALWFEAEGLIVSPERRIQRFGALVPPPGEAMGEAWQLIEVARRLGLGDLFPWDSATHVAGLWAEYSRFRSGPDAALPPLARLASVPGALWPYVEGTETRRRYATAEDPAADRAHGDVDFYGHADHRARIWLRPYEAPAEAPDTDFPLWLTIGPVLEHTGTGTLTRRIPTLHRAAPRAYVEINPEDAAAGVRNGDAVRVVSRRGALVLEARIDHRSQPPRGQVFVPSFDGSNPVTVLTLDATCPLSGQPSNDCAVRVEAATGGRAP